jgi:hypothetical protein
MKTDPQTITWMLFVGWFIVYWIIGGVFFALVAATRFMNMRKARFSCLFTLGSLLAAYGAASMGILLSKAGNVTRCPKLNPEAFHALGEMITCNYRAIFVAGGMCFALLLMAGLVALLFSRVDKAPVVKG